MHNVKAVLALMLTTIASLLVATFRVADAPVLVATPATASTTVTTGVIAGTTAAGSSTAAPIAAPTSPTTTGTPRPASPTVTTAPAKPATTAAATAEAAIVATASPNPSPSAATASPYADGTYTGAAVREPWGTFEVQATVSGGQLVTVSIMSAPGDGHSSRINAIAVPELTQAAIAAQSAQIDTISGATWTSQSYVTSLQSALDSARAAAVTNQAAG